MALTVLQLVTEFCDKMGLPTPSAVVGAADKSGKQYLAVMKGLLRDLSKYRWPQQQLTASFSGSGSTNMGSLYSICGDTYQSLVKDTIWAVDKRIPVTGPLTQQQYQAYLNLDVGGPDYQYYVFGDSLRILPAPAVLENFTLVFETSAMCKSSAGLYRTVPTADNDVFIIPDQPVILGFEYHWLRVKGEVFSDAYADYMTAVASSMAANTGPTFQLDANRSPNRPGIYIPAGNWNVA